MLNSKRLHYIDVLNCIAIFFVLVLHSSQLAFSGNANYSNYITALVLQSLCIPAVYIFFMNSGATLLDYRKKYSTKTFLIKRFKRVVIPFFVWSIIYYLYDIKHRAYPGPSLHPNPSITDFINSFASNNINNLFWFFYTIIALYLVAPIFSVLVDEHKKTLFAIVIANFIFIDCFTYISKLTGLKINNDYLTQPLLTSDFLGFFIIGYLIKENFFNRKGENWLIIIGMVTLMLSIINDLTLKKVHMLNNIGNFLYSIALYLLVKRIVEFLYKYKSYQFKLFGILSGVSLGIYIIHPIFYEAIYKYVFHVTPDNWPKFVQLMNNPYEIFLVPMVSYIILSIVIILLKKYKFVRMIIP